MTYNNEQVVPLEKRVNLRNFKLFNLTIIIIIIIITQVALEKVYGFTTISNNSLAQSCKNGMIAYIAGCVIVLYNKNKQDYIISHAGKTLTCLDFSEDGQFLVTGEVNYFFLF